MKHFIMQFPPSITSSVFLTSVYILCDQMFNLQGRVTHICVIIFNRLQVRYFRRQEESRGSSLTGHPGFLSETDGRISAGARLVFLGLASVGQR
jgi:hypothetical protein